MKLLIAFYAIKLCNSLKFCGNISDVLLSCAGKKNMS